MRHKDIRVVGMPEEGWIVEINGNLVKVKVNRSVACGSCHACAERPDGSFVIEANNIGGLKVGQKVKIELAEGMMVKGALLLYGIPTLGLLVGVIIGNLISKLLNLGSTAQEALPIVFGIVMLVMTFLFIGSRNKKRSKGPKAKIVGTIHKEVVRMPKDPVCGMEVEEGKICSEYEGKKYCFCSETCKQKFEQDPKKYTEENSCCM